MLHYVKTLLQVYKIWKKSVARVPGIPLVRPLGYESKILTTKEKELLTCQRWIPTYIYYKRTLDLTSNIVNYWISLHLKSNIHYRRTLDLTSNIHYWISLHLKSNIQYRRTLDLTSNIHYWISLHLKSK